jgi:hypothetical protein
LFGQSNQFDLFWIKAGESVAMIGSGPVGLTAQKLGSLLGANPQFFWLTFFSSNHDKMSLLSMKVFAAA